MSSLSEVTCVLGQRAAELEQARDIFTSEIRRFTESVLSLLKQRHADTWFSPRIRLDCPAEILFESKPFSVLRGQFAQAAVAVRFKKGALYQAVADLTCGIEYVDNGQQQAFAWMVKLVPFSRYHQLDDAIWHEWKLRHASGLPVGSRHVERANVVHFVARPLSSSLSSELAAQDTRQVLDFLLGCDQAFAQACGVDPVGDE
jgi:hypothetical protein